MVRAEAEKAYGSQTTEVMVGQYMWGTLQAHRVMNNFLRNHFLHHLEVAPHITLYLFKQRAPRGEVSEIKQKVELQSKTLSQTEKTCRELRLRVD